MSEDPTQPPTSPAATPPPAPAEPGAGGHGWGTPAPATHGAPAPSAHPTPDSPPSHQHAPRQQVPHHPAPVAVPRAKQRRPRVWPAVFAAGLLGASLASVGTAFLVGESISPPSPSPTVNSQNAAAPTVAGTPAWAEIAEKVRPSVVAIQVSGASGAGAGSGVVLDEEGRILTNNHVVQGADTLQIMMMDGRLFRAEIVGTDPTTDLAVVQIENPPEELVPGNLGTSASLQVGQPVMAVGNPLGLDSTVTTGIISALERPVMASDSDRSNATITNAIQVDAAINPGNSGGPLFNSAGQVIGINSSIATTSRSAGSVGLGFAIPIDLAHQIAEQLITNGKAEHAFLGVSMTDAAATAGGTTRMGAKVEQVEPGTPAAQAGIEPGDVIVGIDDSAVGSAESLTGFVREYRSGDEVTITVIRDGAEEQLSATLTTRPTD